MPAMPILSKPRAAIASAVAAICVLAATSPLHAQRIDGKDAVDVARTPLEDVGLSKEEVAQVLLDAAKAPYISDGLTTCNDIVRQVARIDMVLGADYDIAGEEKTGMNAKKVAKGVVGSIIPFRSLVREISGAAGDRRKAQAAVRAGMVRRGYLKGLGLGRGCDYPARPKPAPEPSEAAEK